MKSNLGWTSIKVKEVEVGNYVSGIYATHPRKISKVVKESGTVTLYEEGYEGPYKNKLPEDWPIDLLINCITRKPIVELGVTY